ASHEIEKLRAIGEAHKSFCSYHARRQAAGEPFKTIAGQNLVRSKCERIELCLMLMLRALDLSVAPDAEQQLRIELTPDRANNRCRAVDFAQLHFKRLDLIWPDKIGFIQKQNVGALDLQPGRVPEFGTAHQHVRVDQRTDAVE